MEATDGFGVLPHHRWLRTGAERGLAMSALAATLREAEPGTRVRLLLKDGKVVSGTLLSVNGESVDLDDNGEMRIDLSEVKRLNHSARSSARSRKSTPGSGGKA